MNKIFFILISSLLSINALAQRNAIELIRVEIDEDKLGVYKSYSYDKPLKVNYRYEENFTDGHWDYKLWMGFDEQETWIPNDLNDIGVSVGGDNDALVKQLRIPNIELPINCFFKGKATVILKDILIWMPEYPAGTFSKASVVKLVSATPPKYECNTVAEQDI